MRGFKFAGPLIHSSPVDLRQLSQHIVATNVATLHGKPMSNHTFLLSEAAPAAGTTSSMVRTWMSRGHFWLNDPHIKPAEASGLPHRVSFDGAFRIAIMASLCALGVKPTRAWEITMSFADASLDPKRDPGCLYAEGETWLIAPPEGLPHVVELARDSVDANLLASIGTASIVMNLSALREEVARRLAVD